MRNHRPERSAAELNRRKQVGIREDEPLDLEFLSAIEKTLSEWNSDNDEKAYADL
jgi:hypothetical protein